ncbi:tumor necrosis factor receptor superfamily member 25-like isoform X2 [Heptranchias perlo]|uniref:tumor necrosis factor receptor superfamily member 25-like isoform X2 n=1 Tax=Heptranchias perlo TaxID=212740 RepID=UPI00355A7C87
MRTRTGTGTGRQSWVWIRIGLCAVISASGSFSRSTTGDSRGLSGVRWNMTRIIGASWQLGTRQDEVRRRGKRHSEKCPENQYWDTETLHCCQKCPAGFSLGASCEREGGLPLCLHCPRNTYHAYENYSKKCRSCTLCDKEFQTTLHDCTATNNTLCGCHNHQYRQCHQSNCHSFHCQNCSNCTNKQIIRPCLEKIDTQCGDCLPGFHQNGDHCTACTQEQCKNKSTPSCSSCLISKPSSMQIGLKPALVLAVVASLVILLVMLHFLHLKIRRERHVEQPETPTVTVPDEDGKTKNEDKTLPFEIPAPEGKSDAIIDLPTRPLANGNIYGISPQTAVLEPRAVPLEGRTLYEIINLVPVRRWRELMRLLELKDCEIERIEMDVTQSRDQQYEMLRQWGQQHTASVQSVYLALDTMNLSGLAEQLQTKLLNNTNSLI